jgi:hypothetical protein
MHVRLCCILTQISNGQKKRGDTGMERIDIPAALAIYSMSLDVA